MIGFEKKKSGAGINPCMLNFFLLYYFIRKHFYKFNYWKSSDNLKTEFFHSLDLNGFSTWIFVHLAAGVNS